jgi:hypothetical protein
MMTATRCSAARPRPSSRQKRAKRWKDMKLLRYTGGPRNRRRNARTSARTSSDVGARPQELKSGENWSIEQAHSSSPLCRMFCGEDTTTTSRYVK